MVRLSAAERPRREVAADLHVRQPDLLAEVDLADEVHVVEGLPARGVEHVAVAVVQQDRGVRLRVVRDRGALADRAHAGRDEGRPARGRQSIGSTGLSATLVASPLMIRLTSRIGSTKKAPNSRQNRPIPRDWLFRISDERRYCVSPSVMPPIVVANMSLNDMRCVSPRHLPLEGAAEGEARGRPEADAVRAGAVVVGGAVERVRPLVRLEVCRDRTPGRTGGCPTSCAGSSPTSRRRARTGRRRPRGC